MPPETSLLHDYLMETYACGSQYQFSERQNKVNQVVWIMVLTDSAAQLLFTDSTTATVHQVGNYIEVYSCWLIDLMIAHTHTQKKIPRQSALGWWHYWSLSQVQEFLMLTLVCIHATPSWYSPCIFTDSCKRSKQHLCHILCLHRLNCLFMFTGKIWFNFFFIIRITTQGKVRMRSVLSCIYCKSRSNITS